MLAYVIRRLLWAGLLVVAMTFVTFVILFKIPTTCWSGSSIRA